MVLQSRLKIVNKAKQLATYLGNLTKSSHIDETGIQDFLRVNAPRGDKDVHTCIDNMWNNAKSCKHAGANPWFQSARDNFLTEIDVAQGFNDVKDDKVWRKLASYIIKSFRSSLYGFWRAINNGNPQPQPYTPVFTEEGLHSTPDVVLETIGIGATSDANWKTLDTVALTNGLWSEDDTMRVSERHTGNITSFRMTKKVPRCTLIH